MALFAINEVLICYDCGVEAFEDFMIKRGADSWLEEEFAEGEVLDDLCLVVRWVDGFYAGAEVGFGVAVEESGVGVMMTGIRDVMIVVTLLKLLIQAFN